MLEQLMNMIFSASFGYAIIRITSPILFAALASVVAEKAGVTNIGLEGTMMFSSLFGVLFAYWTNNWFVGVLAAMIVGILIGLIIGVFALKLKTNITCRYGYKYSGSGRYHILSLSFHRIKRKHS